MLTIFLHELRMVAREPRFWVPFLLPPVFLILMQAVAYAQFGMGSTALLRDPQLGLLVGILLGTMTVGLAADSFAGERERETLEILLCAPVGVRALFFGKLFALLPLPLLLATVSQLLLWKLGGSGDTLVLAQTLGLTFGLIPFLLCASMLISLFASSVRSAAQMGGVMVMTVLAGTQMTGTWYLSRPIHAVILLLLGWSASLVFAWLGFRRFGR